MTRALTGAAAGLLVLAAACSNGGDGPDTRCHGIAQVPAWTVGFTVAFSDTGTARDTFFLRLHHAADGSGTTGPGVPTTQFDGKAWFTLVPTGTLAVNDTVIDPIHHDTTVGSAVTLSTHPVGFGTFSGGYVSVDLATCTADVGALFFGQMHHTVDGADFGTDSTRIGYSLVQDIPVDSAFVAGGWSFPATKVATRAGAYDFVHAQQYLALSLSGKYAPGVDVDSATISFTAIPAAAPAAPPR